MHQGSSSRDLRYRERCRKKDEAEIVTSSLDCKDLPGNQQGCEVVSAENQFQRGPEVVKRPELFDRSMYIGFDVPDYESTRTLETTLTEEVTEEGASDAVHEQMFGSTGVFPARTGEACSQIDGAQLFEQAPGPVTNAFQEIEIEDELSEIENSRRFLIESGMATSRGFPLVREATGPERARRLARVLEKLGLCVVVVAFIVGSISLSFSLSFEATDPSSEIHELSTESPRGGTTEGPSSPAPAVPSSDARAKFRINLKGFSCGFMDAGGNELCVSAESGICVRRKTLQEVD